MGPFGEKSYADGYREAPEDLYLEDAYQVNDDGVFVEGIEPGGFFSLGSALLIAREDILHVEFFGPRVDSNDGRPVPSATGSEMTSTHDD